jgi:hypothetical protein
VNPDPWDQLDHRVKKGRKVIPDLQEMMELPGLPELPDPQEL